VGGEVFFEGGVGIAAAHAGNEGANASRGLEEFRFFFDGETDEHGARGGCRRVGHGLLGRDEGRLGNARGFGLAQLAVGGHGEERPGVAIHVVFEVENFRKTCAGDLVFGPGAVGVLGVDEVANAAQEAFAIWIAKSAEVQRPMMAQAV
jgi:hypothetical protein